MNRTWTLKLSKHYLQTALNQMFKYWKLQSIFITSKFHLFSLNSLAWYFILACRWGSLLLRLFEDFLGKSSRLWNWNFETAAVLSQTLLWINLRWKLSLFTLDTVWSPPNCSWNSMKWENVPCCDPTCHACCSYSLVTCRVLTFVICSHALFKLSRKTVRTIAHQKASCFPSTSFNLQLWTCQNVLASIIYTLLLVLWKWIMKLQVPSNCSQRAQQLSGIGDIMWNVSQSELATRGNQLWLVKWSFLHGVSQH